MPCRPLLTPEELDELHDQQDMTVRGERLSAFKAATEGRVWWQSKRGEWFLVPADFGRITTKRLMVGRAPGKRRGHALIPRARAR